MGTWKGAIEPFSGLFAEPVDDLGSSIVRCSRLVPNNRSGREKRESIPALRGPGAESERDRIEFLRQYGLDIVALSMMPNVYVSNFMSLVSLLTSTAALGATLKAHVQRGASSESVILITIDA